MLLGIPLQRHRHYCCRSCPGPTSTIPLRSASPTEGGDTGPPENTIEAFRGAVGLGYRYLETDVHLSSDGVLVAFHDENLSRLVGHEAAIADLSWEEISQIELAGGHRIPRLEQLFDEFPEIRFNIDPKSDQAVEPLAEMIKRYDRVDQVGIGSFSQERITTAQRLLGPTLCTSPAPSGAFKVVLAALFRPGWSSPFGCLQIPARWHGLPLSGRWFIRRIQRLGMQVHYWTVNDPDEMRRLLDAGADAIISDNITGLRTVLDEREGSN